MLDSDLLSPVRILAGVKINSKKRLFELISTTLAKKNPDLNAREIFESICAREHLGSTALGNGIAVPHGRIKGTEDVQALFLQLIKPLPYDAEDGRAGRSGFCPDRSEALHRRSYKTACGYRGALQ